MKQNGQAILLLIIVMTVALAIGLSIIQKSLVDVSISSKVEQSSRAYFAAEAGIEKALQGNTSSQSFSETESRIENITDTGQIPCIPGQPGCAQGTGEKQAALEFYDQERRLAKEDVVQVWLADPANPNITNCSGYTCYTQTTLDVFWGNSDTDRAALEVTLIYWDGAKFAPKKLYLDNGNESRTNGFEKVLPCSGFHKPVWSTNEYQCKKTLGDNNPDPIKNPPLPSGLILIRARLLYNSTPQAFAVQSTASCASGCLLPSQARSIISTGASGEAQRKIRLFQQYNYVPPYFDFAIFSASSITK